VNGVTGAADCEPGHVEFPSAEPGDFSGVMGDRAPGRAQAGRDKDEKKDSKTKESGGGRPGRDQGGRR
jgi:hypothetical protein